MPSPKHLIPFFALLIGNAAHSLATVNGTLLTAQEDPRFERALALEEFVNSSGDATIGAFIEAHISAGLVESTGRSTLESHLADVRERCAHAGGLSVIPTGEHTVDFIFESDRGTWCVGLAVEPEAEHRLTAITIQPHVIEASVPAFDWDNVAARLAGYERDGFSGTVLLVRDGQVVLHRGYGHADAKNEISNDTDTVFAIGSIPIDFTRAAILLLEQRGQLSTSDLMSKYVPSVPADKASITLDHLMNARSGLGNFHGIRGKDEDLDLTFIDRSEALNRILGSLLIFEPGTAEAHSHSAWGVLAAIVELVSEMTYDDFLQKEFFSVAGMTRTGMYPLTAGLAASEVAIGEGAMPFGMRSTPQNWGDTSWLVMGSGGMVSTTLDLQRWLKALSSGDILGPQAQLKFWSGGVLAGGNDRGFACVMTEGPHSYSIVCSNSHVDMGDLSSQIGEELAQLAMRSNQMPFSIGLEISLDGDVATIGAVRPKGVAARAGLQPGDIVEGINDESIAGLQGKIFSAARCGTPFRLRIKRGDQALEVRVQPEAR